MSRLLHGLVFLVAISLALGTTRFPGALGAQAGLLPPHTQASPAGAPTEAHADIFTKAPFASCHASTLVELSNGDLLAAWFGGSGEGSADVAIWTSRLPEGSPASAWTPPALLVREPNVATWNPVLFHTRDGRLWLYYKFGPAVAGWTGARMVSSDEGRTWSAPEHLPAGLLGPIRAKPYVAPDGTIVSGSSTESYHAWAAWIERSIDPAGLGWQRLGPYTLSEAAIRALHPQDGALNPGETTGIIQPTVLSLGGKHLRFYARSTENIGRICVSDSFDDGRSWTSPRPLDLPNPNSGIDAVALRDGRVVLIYNPVTSGRTPLSLAVSRDGEHFQLFHTIETGPGEYSYPALIQARDGGLLATYTWHRERIRFARIPLRLVP